jgi:hypothetical protein
MSPPAAGAGAPCVWPLQLEQPPPQPLQLLQLSQQLDSQQSSLQHFVQWSLKTRSRKQLFFFLHFFFLPQPSSQQPLPQPLSQQPLSAQQLDSQQLGAAQQLGSQAGSQQAGSQQAG